MAISNECGRLIANVVIAYNSILLSMLLNRSQTAEKEKPLELLKKISPVAWQHVHFLGHYLFRDCLIQPAGRIDHQLIAAEKANLDRVVATLGSKR